MKWFAALVCVAALGCDDAENSMARQPKAKPQSSILAGNRVSSQNDWQPSGVQRRRTVTAPPRENLKYVEKGQEQFNVFCAPCHDETGNGRGMIVQRGFTPPPSLHAERLRRAGDEHFFDVITNGFGAMYSYADRVAPDDRRAIIAYIRTLQIAGQQAQLTGQEKAELRSDYDPNRARGAQ